MGPMPLEGVPRKTFRVVYADPPWQFKAWSHRGEGKGASQHYTCMDFKQICMLPIQKIVTDERGNSGQAREREMKTLLLSPYPLSVTAPIFNVIEATKDTCLNGVFLETPADLVVLFGHRKILTAEEIEGKNIINMHISLLPWNRGACPNLFSWYEDTPKGVTIHQVTEKVDRGPILFQREIEFRPTVETLKTSYDKLQAAIVRLFCDYWWRLRKPELWVGFPQDERYDGSYHTTIECNELMKHFPMGIDTPVTDVVKFGKDMRVARGVMEERRDALSELAKK